MNCTDKMAEKEKEKILCDNAGSCRSSDSVITVVCVHRNFRPNRKHLSKPDPGFSLHKEESLAIKYSNNDQLSLSDAPTDINSMRESLVSCTNGEATTNDDNFGSTQSAKQNQDDQPEETFSYYSDSNDWDTLIHTVEVAFTDNTDFVKFIKKVIKLEKSLEVKRDDPVFDDNIYTVADMILNPYLKRDMFIDLLNFFANQLLFREDLDFLDQIHVRSFREHAERFGLLPISKDKLNFISNRYKLRKLFTSFHTVDQFLKKMYPK